MASREERAKQKAARKAERARQKEAKRAAKAYRRRGAAKGDKEAYCTTCHEWYNPRKAKENRKHDHV